MLRLPIYNSAGRLGVLGLLFMLTHLSACSDSSDERPDPALAAAVEACTVSTDSQALLCEANCIRLNDPASADACAATCAERQFQTQSLCAESSAPVQAFCAGEDCTAGINRCLASATVTYDNCAADCAPDNDFCRNRCLERRGSDESSCGFVPAAVSSGSPRLPNLESGQPASLHALLDDAELAVVAAADQRAAEHRQRQVRLWTGQPDTEVTITQVEHSFRFGVPLDSREFVDGDGRLDFYADIARRHTRLLVAETSLKWRNTEREEGQLTFDLADFELGWAESLGFDVKAHVLLWGNPPPLASGSGTPEWLRDRFPDTELSEAQKDELRALIRDRIATVVGRYRGRIDVWEVTNEMLNPITSWFIDRLGPGVVDDAFRWAREADPGAELVYNEWINEIFTGLGGPNAGAVRDRIRELRDNGVQIDALGQQGHFAPGLVNVGIDVDLGPEARTRIDDYANALDTLAQAGLPIHITEVTFAAPDDPELRAAQAEAIMRIWWGHPQVEEIIFWNFWNPLGPRSRLNLGVYDEDNNLTRHGEAILSLLNDRWRTRVAKRSREDGMISFPATLGTYVAQWNTADGPVHVRFQVPRATGILDIVAVQSR